MDTIRQQNETSKQIHNTNSRTSRTITFFGIRHIQMFLLFLLIMISYGIKVNLSIGILAMTDPLVNPHFPTFSWTNKEKSILLSSLFWGFVITQIPSGQLAERYGPKWILTFSMASCSLFTFLIPKMAEHSIWACVVCRVLQGLSQGFFFPCVHSMLSKWIPPNERSTMGTFVYSGGLLGTALTMLSTGKLAASSLGWPSAFYLHAILGLIWVFLWSWLGESSPDKDKHISDVEKTYILITCGSSINKEHVPTPWKKIFFSLPAWAVLIANMSFVWCYWTITNEMPAYFSKVLDFDISTNAELSAAPYVAAWLFGFPCAFLSDFLIKKKILTITATRKLATTLGFIVPAIALLILSSEKNRTPINAVILLIIAQATNTASLSGFQVNHLDISPTHAGTLMGITSGIGHLCAIANPIVTGFIIVNEDDASEWTVIFLLATGVYIITSMFFVLFGSGEIQSWDRYEPQKVNGETKDRS